MFVNRISSDSITNKNLPLSWCNSFLRNAVNEPSFQGHLFFMGTKINSKTFLGKTFNYWTVLNEVENTGINKSRTVEAKCVCGKIKKIVLQNILRGTSKSCGCKSLKITHGLSRKTKVYRVYIGMKVRCYQVQSKPYKYYGARGIKICDEWLSDFKVFYDWAMTNGYSEELEIERINNDGNYEPSNCKWETHKKQMGNRRGVRSIEFNGETKILTEWAEQYGIAPTTLDERLKKGLSIGYALNTPVQDGAKLTLNGETKTIFQWAKCLNIRYSTLWGRIKLWGYDAERVLTTPIQKHVRV